MKLWSMYLRSFGPRKTEILEKMLESARDIYGKKIKDNIVCEGNYCCKDIVKKLMKLDPDADEYIPKRIYNEKSNKGCSIQGGKYSRRTRRKLVNRRKTHKRR